MRCLCTPMVTHVLGFSIAFKRSISASAQPSLHQADPKAHGRGQGSVLGLIKRPDPCPTPAHHPSWNGPRRGRAPEKEQPRTNITTRSLHHWLHEPDNPECRKSNASLPSDFVSAHLRETSFVTHLRAERLAMLRECGAVLESPAARAARR